MFAITASISVLTFTHFATFGFGIYVGIKVRNKILKINGS